MIVAFVGMPGSGKSSVIEIVKKQYDCGSVYFGGVVLNYLKSNGLDITPENEKVAREYLRRRYGKHAMAHLSIDSILKLNRQHDYVLIDGLYSFSEYEYLMSELDQLILIAVHANSATRYERLLHREVRPLTREQAIDRDFAEIKNLEKGGPIAIADYHLLNNDGVSKLEKSITSILKQIAS